MKKNVEKVLDAIADLVGDAADQDLGEELRKVLGPVGACVLGYTVGALTDVVGFERADQLLMRLVAQIKALQQ